MDDDKAKIDKKFIKNLQVVLDRPGRIDGGEYIKPKWALVYYYKDMPRKRPIKCGGEQRPLGQDLEDACKGLGLTTEEIYDIPIKE